MENLCITSQCIAQYPEDASVNTNFNPLNLVICLLAHR